MILYNDTHIHTQFSSKQKGLKIQSKAKSSSLLLRYVPKIHLLKLHTLFERNGKSMFPKSLSVYLVTYKLNINACNHWQFPAGVAFWSWKPIRKVKNFKGLGDTRGECSRQYQSWHYWSDCPKDSSSNQAPPFPISKTVASGLSINNTVVTLLIIKQ